MLRVVFCVSKGYRATGKARGGGIYNYSMVELLVAHTDIIRFKSLNTNAKSFSTVVEKHLILGVLPTKSDVARKVKSVCSRSFVIS